MLHPVLLKFICVGFIDENDAHIASWKSQIQEVDHLGQELLLLRVLVRPNLQSVPVGLELIVLPYHIGVQDLWKDVQDGVEGLLRQPIISRNVMFHLRLSVVLPPDAPYILGGAHVVKKLVLLHLGQELQPHDAVRGAQSMRVHGS